jgi:hypothetical protein
MKDCYGTIYPDVTRVPYNEDLVGKVFTVRVNSPGFVHQAPQLKTDVEAWEACRECEEYRSCYDFSNAKLAMRQALRSIP